MAGDSILVPVRITNNPGLSGVELDVTLGAGLEWDFDPATYVRGNPFVTNSPTWPFIVGNPNIIGLGQAARPELSALQSPTTLFAFINVEDMEAFDFVGDGVLITLKLRVSESAVAGNVLTVGINVTACGNAAVTGYAPGEFISVSGTVTVVAAPSITTTSLSYPTGINISGSLEATGTIPITWTKISGPSWLSVASNGTLSGTAPAAAETGTLRVTATNAYGSDENKDIPVTISALPTAPITWPGGDHITRYGDGVVTIPEVSGTDSTTGTVTYSVPAGNGVATISDPSSPVLTILGAGIVEVTATAAGVAWITAPNSVEKNLRAEKLDISIANAAITAKEYDNTLTIPFSNVTPSFSGAVASTSVTYNVTAAAFTDNANFGVGKPTTITVALTGAANTNYNLTDPTYTGAIANVEKKAVTITPTPGQTKVFGTSDPATFDFTPSPALLAGHSFIGKLAYTGTNVGSYPFTLGDLAVSDGNNGNNYALTLGGNVTFRITPATIPTGSITASHTVRFNNLTEQTVSIASLMTAYAGDKTYTPGTPTGATTRLDGSSLIVVDGNLYFTLSGGTDPGANPATLTIPVTVGGMTNYNDYIINVSVTITSKEVATVTLVTIPDGIAYGETLTAPTATSSNSETNFTFNYSGTLADPTNTVYNSTTAPTEPGSYTVSATLVSDTHAGTSAPSAEFTIAKKGLSWNTNGVASGKTYDNTNSATVSTQPTLLGVIDSDNVTRVNGTVAFNAVTVGSQAITAASYGVTGADAWKYNAPSGQPIFPNATINTATLTIQSAMHTRPYSPGSTAAVGVIVTMSGFADGDNEGNVSPYTVTAVYAAADAGTRTLNISSVSLGGAKGENYTVAPNSNFQMAVGQGITKKDVAITGAQTNSKAYDGTLAFPTENVTDVTFDDAGIGSNYAVSSAAFTDNANAGTGKPTTITVALTGIAATNYNLTNPTYTGATADITAIEMPALPDVPKSVRYNETATQTVDLTGYVSIYKLAGDNLVFASGGLVAGTASASITNLNYTAFGITFTVTGGVIGQTASIPVSISGFTNYNNTSVNVVITLTDKETVQVNVTAPSNITYGGTLEAPSASVTGSIGTHSFSYNYTGILSDGNNTAYDSSAAPTNPGTYTVTATLVSDTHAGESTSEPFSIFPKPLTWNIDGVVAEKTYDGSTDATVSTQPTLNGIINSDTVTVTIGSVIYTSATAGTNTVNVSGYSISGPHARKYTTPSSQPTFSVGGITKANQTAPTISGGDITKAYGDAAFSISENVSGGESAGAYSFTSSNTAVATINSSGLVTLGTGASTIGSTNITVKRLGDINFEDSADSAAVLLIVGKANGPTAPLAVTGAYTGNGTTFTYTINAPVGSQYEYSKDGTNFEDSSVFSGIIPLSSVTFYARVKATDTHFAGGVANSGAITFVKLMLDIAPPLNYNIGGNSVTIAEVTGGEYRIESDIDANQDWSSTNTYNFTTGAVLTLFTRLAATGTHNESPDATATVDTNLNTPDTPTAFSLTYQANGEINYTVTIPTIAGAEYSFNGATWSRTRTITGVPGETITGYVRIAAVEGVSNVSGATSTSVTLPSFTVATPTASPNGGTFTTNQDVTLSTVTAGAYIYYTLDGSTPTRGSALYSGVFTLTATTTVRAIAVKAGMTDSAVMSVTFTKSSGDAGFDGGSFTPPTPPMEEFPDEETPLSEDPDIVIPFEDVKEDDWYAKSVMNVYQMGLMTGTSETPMLFSPNALTTRGMMVTILYRLEESPDVSDLENPFDDVADGTWYTNAVIWAHSNDIVSGYGGGKYGPEDNITREQMAVILYNYILQKGYTLPVVQAITFNDEASIASWAINSVKIIQAGGIINGKPGNIYDPKGLATRAEVATIFARYIDLYVENVHNPGSIENHISSVAFPNAIMQAYTGKATLQSIERVLYTSNSDSGLDNML